MGGCQKKKRRNNRCLQTFYDAWYIDIRTGEKKRASQLGCNRDNRSAPRNNENNLRMYRGRKISKGYNSVRKSRYEIKPGCPLLYTHTVTVDGKEQTVSEKIISAGIQQWGKYVTYKGIKTLPLSNVSPIIGKDKKPVPIILGGKCLYTGGRSKKTPKRLTVYGVDEKLGTVSVGWTFSVKTADVRLLRFSNGWERYSLAEQYIF